MDQRSPLLPIIRRQALLVLQAVIVGGLLAGAYSATRPKEYDSQAFVVIGVDASADLDGNNAAKEIDVSLDVQQATSTAVQLRVAEALNEPAAKVRKGINAKAGTQRGQIIFTASDSTPKRAATKVTAYASAYLEIRRETGPLPLQRAVASIEARLEDAQRQIDEATKALADQSLPSEQRAILTRRLGAASQLYDSFYARQQDLQYKLGLVGGDAAITQEGLPPGGPSRPQPVRDTVLGIVLGLLAGLGFATLRERLNDKITDREEVEADLALPVLAEIPVDEIATGRAGHLVAVDDKSGPLVESLRTLRSSLQFLAVDRPLKRIVVTSGSPGEGKSYVAANLAVAYAQAGYKTTLVSSDLRRPGLDRIFVTPAGVPGLSAVIAGFVGRDALGVPDDAGLLTVVRATEVPNLSFVPAGQPPPNAGELLAGQRASQVFNHLARDADVVIFDSPPLLAVSDGAVLASVADGVVLVAAAEQTRRHNLRRSRAALDSANANVLGIALNKAKRNGSGYYAEYYGDSSNDTKGKKPRGRTPKKPDAALTGLG